MPEALPSPESRQAVTGSGALQRLVPAVLFVVTLSVVGYVVFNGVEGLLRSNGLDAQIAALEADVDDLQWEAEQLSALVAYLDSDEYIERTAREDLGLVRPGEEAFGVHAPPRPGLAILRSPWWANLLPEAATPQP